MNKPSAIDGNYKILRPDFVFFSSDTDGNTVADIVDPNCAFLADALPKLKGLAAYVESHTGVYRCIEAVDEVDGKLRRLDLTDDQVRKAIAAYDGDTAAGLYLSEHGLDYPCVKSGSVLVPPSIRPHARLRFSAPLITGIHDEQ